MPGWQPTSTGAPSPRSRVRHPLHAPGLLPLDYVGAARRFPLFRVTAACLTVGHVMAGPPLQPMARFATRVEGGEVLLGGLEDAE